MKTVAAFFLLFSAHVFADMTQERLDAVPNIYKTLEQNVHWDSARH